jgi:uncharacterized protein
MKTIIISISLIINLSFCFGQSKAEIEQLKAINEMPVTGKYNFDRTHKKLADKIISSMYVFYKRYISSQDMSTCGFNPSCSTYALQAIKSQGLVIGVINFFDRFARCNGLSPETYDVDPKLMLLSDPVRNFYYRLTFDKE